MRGLEQYRAENMRWIVDEDGDIGISFYNILTLIKYKDSTIVIWFKKYPTAPKHLRK